MPNPLNDTNYDTEFEVVPLAEPNPMGLVVKVRTLNFASQIIQAYNNKLYYQTAFTKLFNSYKGHLLIYLDPTFEILTISGAVESMLGYKSEDLINTSFVDLISSDNIEEFSSLFAKIKSGKNESVKKIVLTLICKNNKRLLVTFNFMQNIGYKKLLGTIGIIRDFGEEAWHKAVMEGIYILDLESQQFVYATDNMNHLLGCASTEEIVGKQYFDFVHPGEHGRLKSILRKRKSDPEYKQELYVFMGQRADDKNRVVFFETTVEKIEINERRFSVGSIRDVTAKKLTSAMENSIGNIHRVLNTGLEAFCVETRFTSALATLIDHDNDHLVIMAGYNFNLAELDRFYLPINDKFHKLDIENKEVPWDYTRITKLVKENSKIRKKELESFESVFENMNLSPPIFYPLFGKIQNDHGALKLHGEEQIGVIGALLGFMDNKSTKNLISSSNFVNFIVGQIGYAIDSTYYKNWSNLSNKIIATVQPKAWEEERYLKHILDIIKESTRIAGASVFLRNISDRLELIASTADFPEEKVSYNIGEGATGKVAERGCTLTFKNANDPEENSFKSKIKFGEAPDGKYEGWIGVPIKNIAGDVIGVFRAVNYQVSNDPPIYRPFNLKEVFITESIVKLIGLYVDLTQAYHKDRTNLEIIAHEIKSTISSIDGAIDTALHHEAVVKGWASDLEFFLARARTMTNRLEKVAEMTFTLFGRKQIHLQETSLFKDIIAPSVEALSLEYPDLFLLKKYSNFKPKILGRSKVPTIKLDIDSMRHVIMNLLRNAIKYKKKQGDPEINIIIDIPTQPNAEFFKIKIQDGGIGIPSGETESVFDLGQRGSNAINLFKEGYGYGLTVARRIIAHHGGRMFLSHREKPTEFTMQLPTSLLSEER